MNTLTTINGRFMHACPGGGIWDVSDSVWSDFCNRVAFNVSCSVCGDSGHFGYAKEHDA